MGLKSWFQGHGWDGTRETPAEQHTRAMQEQVQAWKARYAEPVRETTTLHHAPTTHGPTRAVPHRVAEVERLAHLVREFQELAAQMQTRATVVREYHERAEQQGNRRDRSQGWER